MSDSVTKYFELVEEGRIEQTPPMIKHTYREQDLTKELVSLAREYTDVGYEFLYQLAKDRLTKR